MRKNAAGFEWFVAWRHLRRDPGRRSRWLLILGATLLVVGIAAFVLSWWLGQRASTPLSSFRPRTPLSVQYLWWGGLVGTMLGVLSLFIGVLLELFTVFATVSVVGVLLGTAAPIIALSVMSGFETDLKGKIRGAKADVVITRREDRAFTGWQEVRRKIASVAGVTASTPYIEGEVMLRSGGTPAGVILRGIDADSAPQVLELVPCTPTLPPSGRCTLKEGQLDDLVHPERVKDAFDVSFRHRALAPEREGDDQDEGEEAAAPRPEAAALPARPTILLGEELYGKSLRVFRGSDMDVVCPQCGTGPTGARPKSKSFRVAGHFYTGMYEFDSKLAYVSLAEAQRFFEMPGEITGLDVRSANPDRAGAVAAAIAERLGPGYEVRSWQELNRELFRALRLEKIAMFIALTFIALVASFSIASLLIMMTTQKGGEVAILKAMGATDGAILRVFFAEGLYIGAIGVAIGMVVGVLVCRWLGTQPLPTDVYYISQLPVVMRGTEIVTVAVVALVLCCLATVYPALRASRMRPVEGLRYE